MDRAGLETMLMNYYRNIDRNQVQFDFLTHRPDSGDYDSEITSLGGRIYRAPRLYPQNYIRYFSYMNRFFLEHPEYKIVHSHIDAMSAFPLAAAKKAKVPIRIAHSHSTSIDKNLKLPIKWMAKNRIPAFATDFFACGKEAACFLFGEKIYQSHNLTIMKNAIQAKDFSYNESIRKQTRQALALNDNFTVGHIGRFTYPKNQDYLIEIFDSLRKLHPNSVLLLIGDGKDKEKIHQKVLRLGLQSKVHFLGIRSDVLNLLQAIDVFVLPSHYEGIPVVGVEAQAADLPCFFSDAVSREAQILDNCQFLSLNSPPEEWAKKILDQQTAERHSREEEIRLAGFDVAREAGKLQEYYLDKWQEITN